MAYLAFDLGALDAIPDVARAAGISEAELAYGLLRMWRYAWSKKTPNVTATHLSGFFAGDVQRLRKTLIDFDFVERITGSEDVFRVKGAERYLRIDQARSKAGKARAASAQRDSSGRLCAGGGAGPASSTEPAHAGEPSSTGPALTPSTEHRALSTESTASSPPPPPKAPPGDPLASPEAFFAQVQFERAAGGLPTEKRIHPSKLGRWWSELHMELNGRTHLLPVLYRAFAKDPFWRAAQPPLPFNAFMSEWRKYVPAEPAGRTGAH